MSEIDRDLYELNLLFYSVKLWNNNEKLIFYRVLSKNGLSSIDIKECKKNKLIVHNCHIAQSIDNSETWLDIIFSKKIPKLSASDYDYGINAKVNQTTSNPR